MSLEMSCPQPNVIEHETSRTPATGDIEPGAALTITCKLDDGSGNFINKSLFCAPSPNVDGMFVLQGDNPTCPGIVICMWKCHIQCLIEILYLSFVKDECMVKGFGYSLYSMKCVLYSLVGQDNLTVRSEIKTLDCVVTFKDKWSVYVTKENPPNRHQ